MLLALDLGNTSLTIGLFQKNKLAATWRLSSDHQRTKDEYGLQITALLERKNHSPDDLSGIIISSVVPPITNWIVQACIDYLGISPLLVTSELKLNVEILYDNPSSVGADRIADAVAAEKLFGSPSCVIDFGTATTFNAIAAGGKYLGGAILPGISTAADSLVSRTAKLPPVELEAPPSVIGRNTRHAMQAGLIFGYVALVEGMVMRFQKELGEDMKVIATGGHVDKISDHTKAIDQVEPWLTLEGLKIIWELNKK
jgi:type III pantothenate kinase